MFTVLVFQLFSESALKHSKTETGGGGQTTASLQRGHMVPSALAAWAFQVKNVIFEKISYYRHKHK